MINEEDFNNLFNLSLSRTCLYNVNIKQYINKIINDNKFEIESFIVSLIYFKKYSELQNINNDNIINIFTACIILANKFLEDTIIKVPYNYELYILNTLDWNLFINREEYDKMVLNVGYLIRC
jgi:hypothetical protein